MALDKKNISISFGQGIDSKTDPNQVVPGKMINLTNCTLAQNQSLQKRNGFESLVPGLTIPATTALNMALATYNNELLLMDTQSLYTYNPINSSNTLIDTFISAQPTVSEISRDPSSQYNPDSAFNSYYGSSLFLWNSSGLASTGGGQPFDQTFSSTFQDFYRFPSGAITNFRILSSNGALIRQGSIQGLSRPRAHSVGNNFVITGVNPSSAVQYYSFAANATSANLFNSSGSFGLLTPTSFSDNRVTQTPRNSIWSRYDTAVLDDSVYVSYFEPASSSISTKIINNLGLISPISSTLSSQDASGGLAVFGDSSFYWIVGFDGISLGKYFVQPTADLSGISTSGSWTLPASTSMGGVYNPLLASSGQLVGKCNYPVNFTGASNGQNANIYYQMFNTYTPVPSSGGMPGLSDSAASEWALPTRSDYIASLPITNFVQGSTAIVMRGVGLTSKAFRYNNKDFLFAAYGVNTPTIIPSRGLRLQPTYFMLAPGQKNQIVSRFAADNAGGYDFLYSGFPYYIEDLGLPLPSVNLISPSRYQTTYLFKNAATPPIGNQLAFIPIILGVNSISMDFNSPNSFVSSAPGPNLNIAGGYLADYDGTSITENNFHLFPEDIRVATAYIGGPATTGNPYFQSQANCLTAGTYSYTALYEWEDAIGNIVRSTPTPAFTATVPPASSAWVWINIPTLRATNKLNVRTKIFRNTPSYDVNTFNDLFPVKSIYSSTGIDDITIIDNSGDSLIIGNPALYTTGGILPDTPAPAPLAMSKYKDRLMITDAENNTTLWYSKEIVAGTSVEMSDLQTLFFSEKYGGLLAHIEMDDKCILFFSNANSGAIFYMTGLGPDATGNNNDFSVPPYFITDIVSTSNQKSLVKIPDGLMFQSNKGIWMIGHGLQVSYIGAPVEAFNQYTVTSANIIPNSTQVQFTLNNGNVLVYDYFQQQWSVYTNINAVSGIIFQGLFTFLQQQPNSFSASIMQETPGIYSDNGNPILRSLTTSWLSFSGFQGYERAYHLYLKGEFITPHILNVSVAYDFNPNPVQTAIIKPTTLRNPVYGGDPLYGSGYTYGGNDPSEQYRINLIRQKCQSIQVTITESQDPSNPVFGAGSVLEALGLVFGSKLTYPKLPASQSVT